MKRSHVKFIALTIAIIFVACAVLIPVTSAFADDDVKSVSEDASGSAETEDSEEPQDVPSVEDRQEGQEGDASQEGSQDEPVVDESVSEPVVQDEPVSEKSAQDNSATEEPSQDESTTEEPATEEPSQNEPTTEEPIAEEPVEDDQSLRRTPKDAADEIQDVMGLSVYLDGDYVVIRYKTAHRNPWDYHYQGNDIIIDYDDGSGDNNNRITFDWDGSGIHGDSWSAISGSYVEKSSDQDDTETAEIYIPVSWFKNLNFTLSGGGFETSIHSDVPADESEESQDEPVYEGIVIDGNFSDWDAVSKYDLQEPNGDNCVECVAWMIENDYVYIYIKDTGTNSATWAGPNHNGKFAITTDLGRTLVLQLTEDGMVTGADGIDAAHNGSQWEIAVPMEMIPQNNGGLDFGLYLYDSSLSGQVEAGNVSSQSGIEYDGIYGDWDVYPHQEIQYSTAGTQENVPDGEAAIYMEDMIYGHCVTQMRAHLDERGGEYTQGVSVFANDDMSHKLEMRLASVDEDGNIDWNPQKQGLEDGTYEYYIFATDCWGSSSNIGSLVPADVCYGRLALTIRDDRQDVEWYVDPVKLADRYGFEETDMKTISSVYIRIGPDAVTTAGTSTAPVGSAGLMLVFAALPALIKKKGILALFGV